MKLQVVTGLMIGLAYVGSASALPITPTSPTPTCTTNDNGGNDTDFLASAACGAGTVTLAYKQNTPTGEEGNSAWYSTSLVTEGTGDYVGATITWTGPGALLCTAANPCWLVVKDGNQTPARYGYNLTGIWDGLETLVLSGFWPGDGSISHIALFGGVCQTNCGDDRDVPEPGTLALLGLGLLGLGLSRRRKA